MIRTFLKASLLALGLGPALDAARPVTLVNRSAKPWRLVALASSKPLKAYVGGTGHWSGRIPAEQAELVLEVPAGATAVLECDQVQHAFRAEAEFLLVDHRNRVLPLFRRGDQPDFATLVYRVDLLRPDPKVELKAWPDDRGVLDRRGPADRVQIQADAFPEADSLPLQERLGQWPERHRQEAWKRRFLEVLAVVAETLRPEA